MRAVHLVLAASFLMVDFGFASPTLMPLIGQVGRRTSSDPCAGNPTVGTVCTGGAIYAGTLSSVEYMVTPGGCGYEPSGSSSTIPGSTFTPTCSGTDTIQKKWAAFAPTPSAHGTSTGATSTTDGPANTSTLVGSYNDTAAARYCHHLELNGYSDWFLPAKDELNLLYTNRASLPGIASANYWSSTENTTTAAWPQNLNSGAQDSNSGKDNLARIRCVRRIVDPCAGKSIGQACSGTVALYAGTYNGYSYMTTPGNCTDSSTPTCDGGSDTLEKKWTNEVSPVTTGIVSDTNGFANTQSLAAMTDKPAAQYCWDMVYGGYSDWYLPADSELNSVLCANKAAIGGFVEGSVRYRASTEFSDVNAKQRIFATCGSSNGAKTNATDRYVRCVRKY